MRRYKIFDRLLGIFEGDTPYKYFLGLDAVSTVRQIWCKVRRYKIFDRLLGIFEGDTPYRYFLCIDAVSTVRRI